MEFKICVLFNVFFKSVIYQQLICNIYFKPFILRGEIRQKRKPASNTSLRIAITSEENQEHYFRNISPL